MVRMGKIIGVGDGGIKIHLNENDRQETNLEPHVGLEFDSAEDAREFYSIYAKQSGFSVRAGQTHRSRVDGSITSRRFVCSKEGFQIHSRIGCRAFIKVNRQKSGKWVVDSFRKEHNHELDSSVKVQPPLSHGKTSATLNSLSDIFDDQGIGSREIISVLKEMDAQAYPPGTIIFESHRRRENEGQPPYVGMEFSSANDVYNFYNAYAIKSGFRIRIGQLYRSRTDGSITSRRYVCSKEGFQQHSRVGCRAFIRVQRREPGKWIVDRFQDDHNHALETGMEVPFPYSQQEMQTASIRSARNELGVGSEKVGFVGQRISNPTKVGQKSSIGSDWYCVLLEYFQSRQAEDPGFFYAVEVDDGRCLNVFWADSRSRFSCCQFGDVVILDTTYRIGAYKVPFASLIGVNHHKQLVLLGCALIADESKESFIWLFQTWLRAMSGCHPLSIIADQDEAMRQAIAQVFPRTRHCFSMWQIRAKEQENLSHLQVIHKDFKDEYENCIHQSQMPYEFEPAWKALLNKYKLEDNNWLKEMYAKREYWVPAYVRDSFFAGITMSSNVTSFFGNLVNAQTPLTEFVSLYEKAVELRRKEESIEDLVTANSRVSLNTKTPMEEQCERLYTRTLFQVFQKELLACQSYSIKKIYEEGILSRYMVQKYENDSERYTVTFDRSNFSVNCSCKMFEFEGMLCRHVLRVFEQINMLEVPSRYILHRWTRDAEYGIIRGAESQGSSQDHTALMIWSLREEARKYIESGVASLETYNLAFKILQEGRKTLDPIKRMVCENIQSNDASLSLEQPMKRHKMCTQP